MGKLMMFFGLIVHCFKGNMDGVIWEMGDIFGCDAVNLSFEVVLFVW